MDKLIAELRETTPKDSGYAETASAAADAIEKLRTALTPFAEPHFMGDNYVRFAPRLIEAARAALK